MLECIICHSSEFRVYFQRLKRCLVCGHITADVDLKSFPAKDIYGISYFKGKEYYDYIKERPCYEKNFSNRLKDVLKYCANGNLLEIGAAYGLFLNLAKKYFSTIGYEICPEAAKYAREEFALDVRVTEFLKDNLEDSSYDVVVMWDVLEHLANPQDFVARIARLLKKNGIFVFTTGDIGSLFARVRGKKWRLIHPPTHLHYFSKNTIRRLLNQFNLEVVRITYPGYWRSLRQIFYNLFVLSQNPKESIFKLTERTGLGNLPVYVNTFDIMQVIAKK